MSDIDHLIVATNASIIQRDATHALDLAKANAPDPSVFERFPPFLWSSEISSDRMDSHYTTMDPDTTLANFAEDAASGVAILVGHNHRELPIGASLTGLLEKHGDVTRVVSDAYALTESSTESVINRIKAGIARDVSVGFSIRGARCECSICGEDMWRSWDCWHIPGFEYEVDIKPKSKDAAGAKETRLCTGRVINARLSEYSLVFDGSTPGASVLAAQRAAEAGKLSARQISIYEQRHRIRLPDQRRVSAVPDLSALEKPMPQETPQTPPTPEPTRSDVSVLLERHVAAEHRATDADGVRWLIAERERLAALADDGAAYRTDLIADTLAEGVRALGESFATETYRAMLSAAPLETIKRMRSDWKSVADQKFPAGRQTVDSPETPEPQEPTPSRAPAAAFRA